MKKNSVKNIILVNVTIKKSCEYKDFMQACLSSSETKQKFIFRALKVQKQSSGGVL